MTRCTRVRGLLAAATVAMLAACGGGGSSPQAPTPTPTPVPAVAITATGEGPIVLHPSLDPRFFFAIETPIRLTETGGGTADWNFARIAFFLQGAEIERYELGAADIERAGFKKIAARSNNLYRVVFRNNSDDFDRIDITLGFADLKDGRQFTAAVPFSSFSDVTISLTPLFVPGAGTVKLGSR